MTSSAKTVTIWIDEIRGGDNRHLSRLMSLYFGRMTGSARRTLRPVRHRAASLDSQAIANSAFFALYEGVREGTLDRVRDRGGWEAAMTAIVRNKAVDHIRRELSVRRGGKETFESLENYAHLPACEDDPSRRIEEDEKVMRLMDALGEKDLQTIAYWYLQHYTGQQIADRMNCSRVTIARKLRRIRLIWETLDEDACRFTLSLREREPEHDSDGLDRRSDRPRLRRVRKKSDQGEKSSD